MAAMKNVITREAFSTALAEFMPSIAEAAVKLTPEKFRDVIGNSVGFSRWVMPMISTGLGAALSKVVGSAIGDKEIATAIQDYMGDIRAVFTAQYGEALRRAHGAVLDKLPPGSADILFSPDNVIIDPDDPLHYHNHACQIVRRFNIEPAVPPSDKKPGRPEKRVPRPELGSMRLDQVIHTPLQSAACCSGIFIADAQLLAQRAAAISKGLPKTAAEKKPMSFLGFLGRAKAGSVKAVTEVDAKRLAGYFHQLLPGEIHGLGEVDTDEELAGLVLADDIDQFRKMVSAAKDRAIHSHLAEALGIPSVTASKVLGWGLSAWEDMGKWAEKQEYEADMRTVARDAKRAAAVPKLPPPPPPRVRIFVRLWRLAAHGVW